MQTTKQKVWNLAKQHELDDFIAKVAKTFPDALEIVHVQTRTENAWCYAGKRGNDYILYRFGEQQVFVFPDEYTLNQALTERSQRIELKDISSY